MKLDAALSEEEKWEVARTSFDEVSFRLTRLETEQKKVQQDLYNLHKLASNILTEINTALEAAFK